MRHTAILLFSIFPACLLAQPVTQIAPLEYRPSSQQTSRSTPRRPPSFAQKLAAPLTERLGRLRQSEIDAVEKDPRLTLMGVERLLGRRAAPRGEWVTLDDGATVWRAAIESDDASGVRLQFTGFSVGTGEVWVSSEDRAQAFGPYTGRGPDDSGEFWSHTVFASTAIVEYRPEPDRHDVPFRIPRILHRMAEQSMAAGTCELDVSCYSDWSAVASGVGLYFFQKGGGGYACTGSLVNNSKNDMKPYFLTANHCVADAAAAKTVDVFWNYQTPSCKGKVPSLAALPQTLGGTFLAGAAIGSGDFSLLLLAPLPNIALTFYGWNGAAAAVQIGDSLTGIHHPQADYKRIAFGVRDPDVNAQVGSELAPANLFYYVRETSGRIEPGSSGSPLFSSAKTIVGTLTYGPSGDACSVSPFSAGYGRFSAALPALASYLSPTATTPPPSTGVVTVTPSPASIKTAWTIGAAAPAAQSIQISTTSTSSLTLAVKASQAWIGLSAASLTVSQGKAATLAVTIGVQGFTAAGANLGSITLTGTGVSQSIAVELDAAAAPITAKGPATVLPLFLDGAGASTTFTLVNPYATPTAASLNFWAANGASLALPAGGLTAASQSLTIPPFGTATIVTAGTSSPQKQGMAIAQSSDAAKRIQAWAQVNSDAIPPAVLTAPPFAIPFDATGAAFTTLYLFNPAASGTLSLSLTIYDTGGAVLGTGSISVPAQMEGSIPMTKTATVFGGKKGMLFVDGKGSVAATALRTAADGRLSSVLPEGLAPQ